jgi:hypothetical protein
MLIGYIIKLITIVILYLYMYRENTRRDRDATAAALTFRQPREETTEKLNDTQNLSAIDRKIEADAIERGMLVCLLFFISSDKVRT